MVELIDSMGDDLTVVNAARVSMAKKSDWDYIVQPSGLDETVTLPAKQVLKDSDAKLIRYLANHRHWTPFSHVVLTLHIKMPIFIARQWYRHTVGLSRNEVSRRYVSDEPEFYMPTELRMAAENVKQGSSDDVHPGSYWMLSNASQVVGRALKLYKSMVAEGVAPEQARMFLPQTMMTEFHETASLAAYARLCNLRLESHAQREIKEYAEKVVQICRRVAPVSWTALVGES